MRPVVVGLGALLVGFAVGHWVIPATTKPVTVAPIQSLATPAPSLTSKEPLLSVAESDSPRRRSELSALNGILRDRGAGHLHALTDYIDNLAPADLAAALLAAHKLPDGADRDLAQRLLVARWADTDPDAALAFAATHKKFDQLTGDVFQQLATTNLNSALARAQAITDPNLHYQALRGALGVMAATDPAGALLLAAGTDNIPRTEPLSSMIYRQWAEADPAAAAASAAQQPADNSWRSPLGQVLRSWANTDPQAAITYATTLTDPSVQSRSVDDIVRRWSEQDAGSVAAWINTVPAGNLRDAAAAAFASSVASTDLPTAVGWAQSISDEAARTSALQRVGRRVMWRDPTNGANTLLSAGVPQEIVQALPPPRGGDR